jgi:hypothetical protein
MSTNRATPPTSTVLLGCSQCGTSLPDGAQFCLKCGKPVSVPPKGAGATETPVVAAEVPRPRRKRRILRWLLLLAVLAGFALWVVVSDSTAAQEIQEFAGLKQDRPILDSAFSIGPHTFRYYKFALPEGSVNVAVVGQFHADADSQNAGARKSPTSSPSAAGKTAGDKTEGDKTVADNNTGIEVLVLTESAFTVWQNGYATSSIYDSGMVAEGNVQADIPAGAGIYYLVFSNKAAPKTPKAVHANVLLRYKSWLPDSLRRMKGRIVEWLGL